MLKTYCSVYSYFSHYWTTTKHKTFFLLPHKKIITRGINNTCVGNPTVYYKKIPKNPLKSRYGFVLVVLNKWHIVQTQ